LIPRRFFWLFDLIGLGLAFLGAYVLAPRIQILVAPGGFLHLSWLEVLSPPLPDWIGQFPPLMELLWILLMMIPATLLFMEVFGGYHPLLWQSRTRVITSSLLAPLGGVSLVTLVLFVLKSPGWSRLFVFSLMTLSGLSLGAYRLTLRSYFLRRLNAGYYAKNVVLAGLTPALEWIIRYFAEHVASEQYRLLGYMSMYPDQPLPTMSLAGGTRLAGQTVPLLGEVSDLGELLIHHPIHEVIAIQPSADGAWLQSVIRDCDYLRVTLRIVPEALLIGELRDLQIRYRAEPLHLPAVVLKPRHLDSEALFVKRLIDVVASAILLIMLSPLFLLIALAIKATTPNLPVFYPWRVIGQNGKPFTGYKFTTMVADADERKTELMPQNEMTGPVFKIKDDPRATPLGRFLRKYSLNELPQLWSVLKGDMSLVGPRPAFQQELARYEFWHKRKLSIRPGITCLWQVRGRNKINDFDNWVRMDLEYIDNWSLWLDFKILIWTVWVVIMGTGS